MKLDIDDTKFFDDPIFGNLWAIKTNGVWWFSGLNIAHSLGYENPEAAVKNHCAPAGIVWREDRPCVSLSNALRLTAFSTSPKATAYGDWLGNDVVPALFKKNSIYCIPSKDETTWRSAMALLIVALIVSFGSLAIHLIAHSDLHKNSITATNPPAIVATAIAALPQEDLILSNLSRKY